MDGMKIGHVKNCYDCVQNADTMLHCERRLMHWRLLFNVVITDWHLLTTAASLVEGLVSTDIGHYISSSHASRSLFPPCRKR